MMCIGGHLLLNAAKAQLDQIKVIDKVSIARTIHLVSSNCCGEETCT
jgi:hypothetical protein